MSKNEQLFDKKKLLKLMIPVALEQTLVVVVGLADMLMVSSVGEHAVSGISLVNTICILMILIFNALASGGAIIIAQYIGQKNYEQACKSANQSIMVSLIISGILSTFAYLFSEQILNLVYGSVEDIVMQSAKTYFEISAFSFIFLALYNSSAGIFRVMNNAKISLQMSVVMNLLNVTINAILIYGFDMGVAGAGFATLISRMVASLLIVNRLRNQQNIIYIDKYFRLGFDKSIINKILKIGIPQAIESSMFQVGKLLTQRLIASFGTAAIAANACANSIESIANIPMLAMGVVLITVVGQCVGYGDYEQARKNSIQVLKYTYMMLLITNPPMFIFAETIVGWFNLSPEGTAYAIVLIRFYTVCCLLISPFAFTISNVLKAAGDVKYTLFTSMFSMWVFRIGSAYLITYFFDLGVLGVWIAMIIDWIVRGIFFVSRFLSNKWENKSLVKE